MRFKKIPQAINPPRQVRASLKGSALLAAIDSGLIPEDKKSRDYNIAPFLRFWDAFLPILQKEFENPDNFGKVLNEQRKE